MMCGILISSPSQAKLIQFALGKQAEEQREKEPLARNLAAFSYYFIFFPAFFGTSKTSEVGWFFAWLKRLNDFWWLAYKLVFFTDRT